MTNIEVAAFNRRALAAEHQVLEFNITEFFERPDDVAAFGRDKIILKATGKMVDTPVAHCFAFRDGKVSRSMNLGNTAAYVEALAA